MNVWQKLVLSAALLWAAAACCWQTNGTIECELAVPLYITVVAIAYVLLSRLQIIKKMQWLVTAGAISTATHFLLRWERSYAIRRWLQHRESGLLALAALLAGAGLVVLLGVFRHREPSGQSEAAPVDRWRKAQTIGQIAAAVLTAGAVIAALVNSNLAWTMYKMQSTPYLQTIVPLSSSMYILPDGKSLRLTITTRNVGHGVAEDCSLAVDLVSGKWHAAGSVYFPTLVDLGMSPYQAVIETTLTFKFDGPVPMLGDTLGLFIDCTYSSAESRQRFQAVDDQGLVIQERAHNAEGLVQLRIGGTHEAHMRVNDRWLLHALETMRRVESYLHKRP